MAEKAEKASGRQSGRGDWNRRLRKLSAAEIYNLPALAPREHPFAEDPPQEAVQSEEAIPRAAPALPSAGLPPGEYLVSVTGRSMEPTISDEQRVKVVVPAGRIAFGDVLLVRSDQLQFVHRLVGWKAGGLRTKGDGRGHFDGWLSLPEEVFGRVSHLPRDGSLASCERLPGRIHALAAGAWSALCGHLYRLAFHLDRSLPGAGYRDDIEALNRWGFRLLHRLR